MGASCSGECGILERVDYHRFEGIYSLQLHPLRWKQYDPPKCWYRSARLQGITLQET